MGPTLHSRLPNNHVNTNSSPAPHIQTTREVSQALHANKPVVALESTIIAHGMPYPENLHCANALEQTIRANGATPATVAVIHGIPHVGLSQTQLQLLASPTSKVRKLALRDLPLAYARRQHGATTVSATMSISSAVGISVFATGGIGGVHRGVKDSWDISADIAALAHIPQLVVCAGAKSLLDVPKTLEALESASVPVLVYKHAYFPSFYTRGTLPAPARVESETEAAQVVIAARAAKLQGVLLAVPVPSEYEADAMVVEQATQHALRELDMQNPPVPPPQITPFLLKRIAQLTGGASLRTNVQLARNNAAVAARVAVQLCKLSKAVTLPGPLGVPEISERKDVPHVAPPEIVVLGGVALDILCDANRNSRLQLGVSNRGQIRQSLGGVARNVAETARQSGARVSFFSAVGDDAGGQTVLRGMREAGWDVRNILVRPGIRTSSCCAVHDDKGDLSVAIGDMDDAFESASLVSAKEPELRNALRSAKIACLDANLSPADMHAFASLCSTFNTPIWYEPTTPQKALRILEANALQHITYLSPNEDELQSLAGALGAASNESLHHMAETVLRKGGAVEDQRLLVTRGAKGVSSFRIESGRLVEKLFAAIQIDVVNTVGAGDCFAGTCLAALARGLEEDEAVRLGMAAAAECCLGAESVGKTFAKL